MSRAAIEYCQSLSAPYMQGFVIARESLLILGQVYKDTAGSPSKGIVVKGYSLGTITLWVFLGEALSAS